MAWIDLAKRANERRAQILEERKDTLDDPNLPEGVKVKRLEKLDALLEGRGGGRLYRQG